MFQIVQASPIYHFSTDAMIGTKYTILPMTYYTQAYAFRKSMDMTDRNYRDCGDDHFYAIRAGEKALDEFGKPNRCGPCVDDLALVEFPF